MHALEGPLLFPGVVHLSFPRAQEDSVVQGDLSMGIVRSMAPCMVPALEGVLEWTRELVQAPGPVY